MGLFGGIKKAVTGTVKLATAPVRGVARFAGTGLETAGKTVGKLAEGDIKGAGGALVTGAKDQLGNVKKNFTEPFKNAGQIAGGFGEFVGGGASLIGAPVRAGARIATAPLRGAAGVVGGGLVASGQILGELSDGDVGGAVGVAKQTAGGVVDSVQGSSAWGFASGAANGIGAYASQQKQAFQRDLSTVGNGIQSGLGTIGNGIQSGYNGGVNYVEGQVQSHVSAFNTGVDAFGNAASSGGRILGQGLEGAGVALQNAAG